MVDAGLRHELFYRNFRALSRASQLRITFRDKMRVISERPNVRSCQLEEFATSPVAVSQQPLVDRPMVW